MRKGILILILGLFFSTINAQVDSTTHFQLVSGYGIDYFSVPYSRTFNVYSIGLGYKGPKTSLYGIYNAGNLMEPQENGQYFNIEDQFELDFYHKLTKRINYWLNYAYSPDIHFPEHRAMARAWVNLGSGFLVSAGGKYYYFDNNLFTTTLGLEKYMGRFWLEGKGFLHIKEPDPRLSYQLNARVFWRDYNYVQLSLMTGASQDEPWRTDGLLPPTLDSHGAGLKVVTYVGKSRKLQLRLNGLYQYEEYEEGSWRNRFAGGVSINYTIF